MLYRFGTGHQNMQLIRKVLCWIFACTSFLYLENFHQVILYIVHQRYTPSVLHSLLIAASVDTIVVGISGVAWWVIWKGITSAKGWGIAASVIHILIFLRQFIFLSQPVWGRHVGALIIGTVGLVAFLWPDKQRNSIQQPRT
jgi:hypothetical protein